MYKYFLSLLIFVCSTSVSDAQISKNDFSFLNLQNNVNRHEDEIAKLRKELSELKNSVEPKQVSKIWTATPDKEGWVCGPGGCMPISALPAETVYIDSSGSKRMRADDDGADWKAVGDEWHRPSNGKLSRGASWVTPPSESTAEYRYRFTPQPGVYYTPPPTPPQSMNTNVIPSTYRNVIRTPAVSQTPFVVSNPGQLNYVAQGVQAVGMTRTIPLTTAAPRNMLYRDVGRVQAPTRTTARAAVIRGGINLNVSRSMQGCASGFG